MIDQPYEILYYISSRFLYDLDLLGYTCSIYCAMFANTGMLLDHRACNQHISASFDGEMRPWLYDG
jgi:hypothetical protein